MVVRPSFCTLLGTSLRRTRPVLLLLLVLNIGSNDPTISLAYYRRDQGGTDLILLSGIRDRTNFALRTVFATGTTKE